MKKIVVLSRHNDRLVKSLNLPENMSYIFSESTDVLPDTSCVLISQEFAGDKLRDIINLFSRKNMPYAVVTFNKSEKNEMLLLDCGILNIIKLPMTPELFKKRITALIGTAETSDNNSDIGFELISQMASSDDQFGAYVVQEADFTKIYRFVLRLQERMEKKAQLVKFTFCNEAGKVYEPGILEDAFPIVQKCLRRGDIASIYGNCMLAILMCADDDGGRVAADRIVNTYNAHRCDSGYEMEYDINEIK